MRLLTSVTFLFILASCNPSPQITESASADKEINENAPYKWGNTNFPKTLRLDSSFGSDEVTDIKAMGSAWKTAVDDEETFFAYGTEVEPNTFNLNRPDGVMGIYKATTWPEDIDDDALAITQIFGRRYNTGKDSEYVAIEHADIIVNEEGFDFYTTSSEPGSYDLKTVLLHEMGHFLGLQHIPSFYNRPESEYHLSSTQYRASSVMYPSVNDTDVKRVPQNRDIDELSSKYLLGARGTMAIVAASRMIQAAATDVPGSNIRIVIELKASGECVHKEDGAVIRRHQLKVK